MKRKGKRTGVDLYTGLALPKNPPKRRPKLRAWIVKQRCLVERVTGFQCAMKVHAAHVSTGTRGMGMKGDDLYVPLCFYHHIDQQHGRGEEWFQRTYGINLRERAEEYLKQFEQEMAA